MVISLNASTLGARLAVLHVGHLRIGLLRIRSRPISADQLARTFQNRRPSSRQRGDQN